MDETLKALMVALVRQDTLRVRKLLATTPALATAALHYDGGKATPSPEILQRLGCYFYAGDTALHVAAAAHLPAFVKLLLAAGADPRAANRRGTTPLHLAAAGAADAPGFDAKAQLETITILVAAGADPEAANKDGATPLHRAIRSRCSTSVAALLELGASPVRPNGSGSSPMLLATHATGRGGSGAPALRHEQAAIIRLLEEAGASA